MISLKVKCAFLQSSSDMLEKKKGVYREMINVAYLDPHRTISKSVCYYHLMKMSHNSHSHKFECWKYLKKKLNCYNPGERPDSFSQNDVK